MRLDLSHIRRPETAFLRHYEPSAFAGDDEAFQVAAPVTLGFTIYKDRDRFRLAGRVSTVLDVACSRCLETFPLPVDAAFDLRYLPAPSAEPPGGAGETAVSDDDVSVEFYRDDAIDLAALVREQFYLVLPMKPLCQSACRGLCPQCGANLNLGGCGCRAAWEDPRLAGLRALLPDRTHDDA